MLSIQNTSEGILEMNWRCPRKGSPFADYSLTNLDIGALCFSPNYAEDKTILAGTAEGVYLSMDGGASWEMIGIPVGR
jgi:hypothetical protein